MTIPRYPAHEEEPNYISLFPPINPGQSQYGTANPTIPSFYGHPTSFARPEYSIWRPNDSKKTEFSYANYKPEFQRPPGMEGYPAAGNSYRYPYPQEPIYQYPSHDPGFSRGGYYMPPRGNEWRMPRYETQNPYYQGVPPGLNTMNMPHYRGMDYRNSNMEYRPRVTPTTYSAFLEDFKQKLT